MGKRERYEPGTFCSVDLATTDPAGARVFDGGLFGWEAEPVPGGEETAYAMMKLDGDEVCAVYETHGDWGEGVAPSRWFSSVSVESADARAARAAELGGEALGEAFEVFDMGRVAVMRDPTGAVFGAWQPRSYAGARRVNDPGCLSLNQLNTRDPERAAGFYADLFGWEIEQVSDEPPYWGINNKGWLNGGMMGMPDDAGGTPSHWLVYFTAEDADAAAKRIAELGGTVMVPPMGIASGGRICVARDPQGAVFALFEGETDD
ncbi:MAG TPA: VOC family protein [Rubrobacteraceae bacterium]|nr:VOC family protein [Rubrobacteraceae bacterium]